MKFRDLDIPESLRNSLETKGFDEMYPPQAEAIPKALTGKSLVAAVPTASGKSMIGIVPALNMVLTQRLGIMYIVPLKALATEKRDDFESFGRELGIKVVMTTGDPDRDDNVEGADIVVATSEKADSMLRHENRWIRNLGMIIADEVHMIHDPGRGPTLEVAMTKFMRRNANLQIIALSATISNSLDLALWLNADHVKMDWRPTKLKEGVYFDEKISFNDNSVTVVPPELSSKGVPLKTAEPVWRMIKQTIEEGGQCVVFVNSRRSTESMAGKYAENMKALTGAHINESERQLIEGGSESTAMGKKLAQCVDSGIAFHHAGLDYKQRRCVEEGFRFRNIKCIVATPTLAAGINLPARRVIIRDTTRFESNAGNVALPVMEIKQMCGRAGRPGYDPWGEAVLIAKSDEDRQHLFDDYVYAESERLTSKLGNERVLRSHLLGLIATGDAECEEDIVGFMEMTFYGATCELYGLDSVISKVVGFLDEQEMIERTGDRFRITPFGKRVSDLYIDPWTAVILKKAVLRIDSGADELAIMQAVACTPDVMGLYPKKDDIEELEALDTEYEGKFLCSMEDECGGDGNSEMDRDIHLSDLKTALLLVRWISEMSEEVMTETLKIGPGDIRSRVDSADWILYAMNEIALIFNPDASGIVKPLLTRVRYGIREELIPLVSLRGIARSRARTLFDAGIRTRQDVANADESFLAGLRKIGKALAHSLKEQTSSVKTTEYIPDEREPVDLDMEYMLEKMAAEDEAKNNPAPATEPSAGKKKGNASVIKSPRQCSLDSF